MSSLSELQIRYEQIRHLLDRPWEGKENLVGSLVDRTLVRLQNCGDYPKDAMIVFLQSLRAASNGSYAFGSLWKTLRDERTVDAWIYDPSERWRSVSFEFQLHQGLDPRDLILVVSTFVPFGVDGDSTHYPVEQSTAYMRSTQELHPVFHMATKKILTTVSAASDSRDSSRSGSDGRELVLRSGNTSSDGWTSRNSASHGKGTEEADITTKGFPLHKDDRKTRTDSERSSKDYSHEQRTDYSNSRSSESATSRRESQDWNSRRASSESHEERSELSEELTFVAVGPDFSHPDKLLAAWRADPANAESSKAIDLVLCSVPSLSRLIEQGVSHRRLSARVSRSHVKHDEEREEQAFWDEASTLVGFYNPGLYGERNVAAHDGRPQRILPQAIVDAIASAQGQLAYLAEFRRKQLPGG